MNNRVVWCPKCNRIKYNPFFEQKGYCFDCEIETITIDTPWEKIVNNFNKKVFKKVFKLDQEIKIYITKQELTELLL